MASAAPDSGSASLGSSVRYTGRWLNSATETRATVKEASSGGPRSEERVGTLQALPALSSQLVSGASSSSPRSMSSSRLSQLSKHR